ncbi:hypothetical protein D3C87_1194730 [compost metagenome]
MVHNSFEVRCLRPYSPLFRNGFQRLPLRFLLSGGQTSDISYAQPLLKGVIIPAAQRGRPRKRCERLLAEKGYDAEALRKYCDRHQRRLGRC